MIYVRLMGGLGNQMFQYALGRRLSIDLKAGLALDHSHLENQPEGEVAREYELDCFNLQVKHIYKPAEGAYRKNLFTRHRNINIVRERVSYLDRQILNTKDNSLLIGYWQDESYFKKYAGQLKKDLVFVKPLSPKKQAVAELIKQSAGSVALQIRRGDYVNHKASSAFHGLLPLSYYNAAASKLAQTIKQPVFFIISDDTDWCKQHLRLNYPVFFVEHVPNTGQEDMNLMSRCEHQIIANSTFGWWAAWLNNNPNKVIVAPRRWFKNKGANQASRIVPKDWRTV